MALDWGILHWIQTYLACPALDAIMPRLTLLGDIGFIWILTGVVLLCTKKHRRTGILLLLGLLCGALVGNVVLKNLVARPRPCWLDESVQLLIATPKDFSFPLGAYALFHHWGNDLNARRPPLRLCGHSARRAARLLSSLFICALSERRVRRRGAGACDR